MKKFKPNPAKVATMTEKQLKWFNCLLEFEFIPSGRQTRRDKNHMMRKHQKWPLGTKVMVKTLQGYFDGRIHKHWRSDESPHGALVEFGVAIDLGTANGVRSAHTIPFRNMKPIKD